MLLQHNKNEKLLGIRRWFDWSAGPLQKPEEFVSCYDLVFKLAMRGREKQCLDLLSRETKRYLRRVVSSMMQSDAPLVEAQLVEVWKKDWTNYERHRDMIGKIYLYMVIVLHFLAVLICALYLLNSLWMLYIYIYIYILYI